MSNPITFSDFTLDFKMCHMPKKDKFVANSEKILHFFLIFGLIFSWVKKGISYHSNCRNARPVTGSPGEFSNLKLMILLPIYYYKSFVLDVR